MNTYRAFVLNTTDSLKPTVSVAYVRGAKYGDAWKTAAAVLNGEGAEKLYSDPECKVDAKLGHGAHLKCGKVEDIKPRNVKLDAAKIGEIMADAKLTAQQKLDAIAAVSGNTLVKAPAGATV